MADTDTNAEEQPIIVKKIIKKAGHGGAHGGAWKVAYADFVTAMMCLFLLLWLINVDPSTKSAVAEFFRQPTQTGPMAGNVFIFGGARNPAEPGSFEGGSSFLEFEKIKLTGQNKDEVMKAIQIEMKKEMEVEADKELYDRMHLSLVNNGILIELTELDHKPLFDSGSSILTEEAATIVDKLAHAIKDKTAKIILSGYTDRKSFGFGSYDNWNLSTDRAHAIRKRLLYNGIDRERVVRVDGYGDTQLKLPDSPLSSANRRITILLLQEDKEDTITPQYLNPEDALPHLQHEKIRESNIKKGHAHSSSKSKLENRIVKHSDDTHSNHHDKKPHGHTKTSHGHSEAHTDPHNKHTEAGHSQDKSHSQTNTAHHNEHQKAGKDHDSHERYQSPSAGRETKPPSLEELRKRKKRRAIKGVFDPKTAAASSGGH